MSGPLILLVGRKVDNFLGSLDSLDLIVLGGEQSERVDALLAAHEGGHEVHLAIRDDGFDFLIVDKRLEEDCGAVVVQEEGVVEL